MAVASGPIRDDELASLFAGSLTYPLALAVSGGADSLALMYLVGRFAKITGVPAKSADGRANTIVLTVDHGLRPNSASEAQWVAIQAARLGFEHAILTWTAGKPATGVQEAARAARYALMREFLWREAGEDVARLRAVVTAHHQDDQAETLLMRLARGSGVDGLAGMRPRSEAFGVTLIRPLLSVPKARLVSTLAAAGERWLEDPSNDSLRFERVRWRAAGTELERLGLTSEPIAASARRLARAAAALDAATTALAREAALDLHGGAFATLSRAAFSAAPEDLRVRLLTRLVTWFGGQETPPSLSAVEDLDARLASCASETSTLGGAVIAAGDTAVEVYREVGREGLPAISLRPGESKLWDRRFTVTLSAEEPHREQIDVGALGPEGCAEVRERLSGKLPLPARIAVTLPAFRNGNRLLAVPGLGFSTPSGAPGHFTATFLWPAGRVRAPGWPET